MTITALESTATAPKRPLALVGPALVPRCPPPAVPPLRLVPPLAGAAVPGREAVAPHPVTTRPVVRHPVRLTRRGRLLATVAVFALIAGLATTAAGGRTGHAPPGAAASSVVVQPGDTLWAVAVRADPAADPRVTIERILKLNGMSDATVRPGQRLVLPRR